MQGGIKMDKVKKEMFESYIKSGIKSLFLENVTSNG